MCVCLAATTREDPRARLFDSSQVNKSRPALLSVSGLTGPYVTMEGGVPVVDSSGAIVGAVGVSGRQPGEDQEIALGCVGEAKARL